MITAMYLRKSRAEEKEAVAETLSRHRDILTEFADKENLNIIRIYEEVASGDSLYKRPEMLRLLEDLPSYEAVLCMDIDRLGRGAMREQGLIFETFKLYGVLIVTPAKTYDMANDMDDSLISFKALFAREEYKMIRGRLRRGTLKAVEEGCYLSNAPFGYKQVRVNKKPTLEIVPSEAEGIKLIFNRYCEGYGCQTIADELHALGYMPRRGQKFNRTTIAKIIRNPVYTGKVVWNQYSFERPTKPGQKHVKRLKPQSEWVTVDGLHRPIISKELYDEANKRLQGKYHPPYNRGQIENPFAGILYCAKCGRSMVRQPLKGKEYNQPVLLCPTAGCMMSSSVSTVEDVFYSAINTELRMIGTKTEDETPIGSASVTETAKAELSRLRIQSDKLHDLLEQGVYDIETFVARRDDLNKRIEKTQGIIEAGSRRIDRRELRRKLEHLLEVYWDGTPFERNQLLKYVIKRVEYNKPKGSKWGTLPTLEIVEWRE